MLDPDANGDCPMYDTSFNIAGAEGQESKFQLEVWLCTIVVWILVYFCVFKGVKSSSYVVWVTVPLPVVFVFIMVMKGLTLENADEGIRMYLLGEIDGVRPDIGEKLQQASMWGEACGQIFFSIGVCMGVMTSYSSYNPTDKPIIGDSFRVSLGNSCFSFFAGFSVFSTVGYLKGLDSAVQDKTSSIGLAFIAYPTSIETLPGANFWTFMLATTLFTLGIDSAFSLLEATSTVIYDTEAGRKIPRKVTALILCVFGCCVSTLFCSNWGFTLFDVVDHYLSVYLMLLLGILQCFGSAWVYEAENVMHEVNTRSVAILAGGYWALILILIPCAQFIFPETAWVAIPIFWVITIILWIVSFMTSGVSFSHWYSTVFFYGARKLSRCMSKLTVGELQPG